jgi:hypothetical protein
VTKILLKVYKKFKHHYLGCFFTSDFLTSVDLVTVLLTVSTFALEVSVAGLTVSTFTVVSDFVTLDDDESTLAESAAPPDLLPLQAITDKEMAKAKNGNLNAFFIMLFFKMLIINNIYTVWFFNG